MTSIDVDIKRLIDAKNARIEALEARIESLSVDLVALTLVATTKGILKPLPPEDEGFQGVI